MPLEPSDFVIRILSALGLGMLIGIERQLGQHPAGLRTNALVCLGSALFVTLSQLIAGEKDSPTRIAAQVVSGIGFLGGGAILRDGLTVRGMNTAATLWCSAAVGTLVGAGELLIALLGTLAIVGSHLLFRPLAHAIDQYSQGKGETEVLYEVRVTLLRPQVDATRALLIEKIKSTRLRLQGVSMADSEGQDRVELVLHLFALKREDQAMNDLISLVAENGNVSSISWGKGR